MAIYLEAKSLQFLLVCYGIRLVFKAGEHHAADIKTIAAEGVYQTQDVHIVSDAQITAALALFDVVSVDGDDDFRLVLELEEHPNLVVRGKARQYAAGVIIVKKFPSKFKIELVAEHSDALLDFIRLNSKVFILVETKFVHSVCEMRFCKSSIFFNFGIL